MLLYLKSFGEKVVKTSEKEEPRNSEKSKLEMLHKKFKRLDENIGELNHYVRKEDLILAELKGVVERIREIEEIEKIIQQSEGKWEAKEEGNKQLKGAIKTKDLSTLKKIVKNNPQNIKINEKTLLDILSEWKVKEFEGLAYEWKNFRENENELGGAVWSVRFVLEQLSGIDYLDEMSAKRELRSHPKLFLQPKEKSKEWKKLENAWERLVENFNKLDDLHDLKFFDLDISLDTIEKIERIKRVIKDMKEEGEKSTKEESPEEINKIKEVRERVENAIKYRSIDGIDIKDIRFLGSILNEITKELDKWEIEEWEKAKGEFNRFFENREKIGNYKVEVKEAFDSAEYTINKLKEGCSGRSPPISGQLRWLFKPRG
jgi:hypothetical protein